MEDNRKSRIENPKIEVGWVLVGRFDEADRRAAAWARQQMRAVLREDFPQFEWQFPTVARRELQAGAPVEPVALLDGGEADRDTRRWDMALVVTPAELVSHFKPYALGVPSRAVQAAVASTARLDPEALPAFPDEPETGTAERHDVLGRRLHALLMHLFGHLGGLGHADDPQDFMFAPRALGDLDRMHAYSEEARAELLDELRDVADERLEEEETGASWRPVRFYLRAAWQERGDIARAVAQSQPWTFPARFSRLTVAAVSTLVVMLTTAEAWELGMTQPPVRVAVLSLGTLFGASTYLVSKQRLLSRRRVPRLSEQRVVTVTAITSAVGLGMAVTYLLLFTLTLVLGLTLFSGALVEGWAASLEGPLAAEHYLSLAGFVAAFGLVIGALGGSFEEESYFRHVAFADEET